MGYFIIVILILAYFVESVQLAEIQPEYVTKCWNQWRVVRDYGNTPSAWLNHVYLVEEICKTGVSVDEMDKCTRQHVDVGAEHILAFWNGIRDKYRRVCKHYTDYLRYQACRTNRHVILAYDDCPKKHMGNDCSAQERMRKCIKKAIKRHCTGEPAEFFTNLIDTELEPIFHYMECSIDRWHGVEYVRVKDRTTVKTPAVSTAQQPETHKDEGEMEEIKEENIIIKTELTELEVSVYSASTTTRWSIATTLIGHLVCVLFYSY